MDYKELIERLRKAVISPFDLGPVADAIESLLAENERLNAELAKQNDPVAEVLSLFPGEPDSYINARAIGVDPFNTWTFPQPGTKLYTIPPTAEQIANETAEACARYVNRFINGDGILNEVWISEIEEALRCGAWKGFKK